MRDTTALQLAQNCQPAGKPPSTKYLLHTGCAAAAVDRLGGTEGGQTCGQIREACQVARGAA